MANTKSSQCAVCCGAIVPGTLYCWRHGAEAPRVGQLRHDSGQLQWVTDPKNTSSQAERLYAVLVGEKQVVVLPEAIDCESSPGKARFEVSETPQSSKPIAVTVDLAALLEAEIDGKEWIEADRAER